MSKSFLSFRKGSKDKSPSDNNATIEAKKGGFVNAKTGGITKATVLVNKTKNTLYLRDKVGPAYGSIRYKIPGNSELEVAPLQHTFFKMLAYAGEEGSEPKAESSTQKKTTTDTKLTIDSEQLSDNKRITITWEDSKYKLECLPR